MTEEHIRIVEINGIKMEIDTRTAKRIDTYRVGDPVKLLRKGYSGYNIYPGIIIDFVEFEKLPTISVAYLDAEALFIVAINAESKDVEIAPTNVLELSVSEQDLLDRIDRKIAQQERDLADTRKQRELICQRFKAYFEAHAEMGGKALL